MLPDLMLLFWRMFTRTAEGQSCSSETGEKRATKFPPVHKYLDKQMANGCVKRSPVPVLTATSEGVL